MDNQGHRRPLGATELYSSRCHAAGGNMNVMVALTVHTRAALDIGLVKITLQELQHQFPILTSRIRQDGGKTEFCPMECPVLPLDTDLQCKDMLHSKFDTERGPLWRVQIITMQEMEKASLKFGPEVEAILEDDSSQETRWRYLLRYLQGRLNQDIDSFREEKEEGAEEEGRSVIVMAFHPSITDITGAFYLARQFMALLDLQLESDGPLQLGNPEAITPSVETLIPSPDSSFQFGDLFPMVKAVGSHFVPVRRSPLEPELRAPPLELRGEEEIGRSLFLRGWLTEAETAEVLALCEEDDVTLHGLVLAAGLTAVARLCHGPSSSPTTATSIRAGVATSLRQYCTPAPRTGVYTAPYEENYSVPPVVDAEDLWKFAHQLSMQHNTAKATRQPLRQLRMYSKMFSTPGGEAGFRDMENSRRVTSEMGLAVHGDLGHIFRRESSVDELSSWTRHQQPTVQVKLEDVFPMVAGQNMGSPFTHSAHLYQARSGRHLFYSLCMHTYRFNIPAQAELHSGLPHNLRGHPQGPATEG